MSNFESPPGISGNLMGLANIDLGLSGNLTLDQILVYYVSEKN